MLVDWNFNDEGANSTARQINRQKSARNLVILQFEPWESCATFFDLKRGTIHTATLTQCDCRDFTRVSLSSGNTFKPCMHIYRLADQLGIYKAKYLIGSGCWSEPAQLAANNVLSPEETEYCIQNSRLALASALARQETKRLQELPLDDSAWGHWSSEIHYSGIQKIRQYRAYIICKEESNSISTIDGGWYVREHNVTLSICDCPDFRWRRLPCKHIYSAALASSISLPFTFSEYDLARKDWRYIPLFLGSRSFNFADYDSANQLGAVKLIDGFWKVE